MSFTYTNTDWNNNLARKILKPLSILYFALVIIAVLYTWFITRDRYITETTFKISRHEATSGAESGLAQMALPGLTDTGSMDSQVAIGYILSSDLLLDLEKQYNLIEHYSSPKLDIVFRLAKAAPLEERLQYYRKRIIAHYDITTGLTLVTVDAFDPELAHKMADTLMKKAEEFINKINNDIANQQLSFVRSEVERASQNVSKIQKELFELQNKHKLIDPTQVISTSQTALQEMQLERLRVDAELASLLRDSPGSPKINTLKSRLRSLNDLIENETSKLSGTDRDRLNKILMDFQEIQLKLDTATRLRTGAELLLEQTRADAVMRSKFFSLIQEPFMPEDVALPMRGYATATILVLGILCFFILRALTSSVFDRV
jgi:capsular polysaccharide transport system permease protein